MLNKTTAPIHISIIGGGNMAGAIIGGLCGTGRLDEHNKPAKAALCQPHNIGVIDINADSLIRLKGQYGVQTSQTIDENIKQSHVVLLSVKPQQMREVAQKIAPHLTNQLVISIAAGIRVTDLSRWLNNYATIVRTMPNMPALINQGITGIYANPSVDEEQRAIANAILSAVGDTIWLNDESQLDSITALSGSGPAYVFYFIEAMQKAAEELGFTSEQGRQLAMATFAGAVQLAMNSPESVSTLRERVTSKGGTTYAALTSLEQSEVEKSIIKAIAAAAKRSKDLGEEFGR